MLVAAPTGGLRSRVKVSGALEVLVEPSRPAPRDGGVEGQGALRAEALQRSKALFCQGDPGGCRRAWRGELRLRPPATRGRRGCPAFPPSRPGGGASARLRRAVPAVEALRYVGSLWLRGLSGCVDRGASGVGVGECGGQAC